MKTFFNKSQSLIILLLTLLSYSTFAQGTTSSKDHVIADKDLKAYVGEYAFDKAAAQGFDISVTLSGENKLMAQPSNKSQPLTMLVAKSEDKFELMNTGGLIMTFQKDKKGKIISLKISEGGQSFTCMRKEE